MSGSLIDFEELDAEVFIETGTFRGDTTQRAADSERFLFVHSIELDREMYFQAVSKFFDHHTIRLYHGSSANVLPLIVKRNRSTTFWLDAHKTIVGGQVAGEFLTKGECPLLIELDIILSKPWTVPCIVIVDDARMFGDEWWIKGQYSEQFNREAWPTTFEIVDRLVTAGFRVSMKDDKITGKKS